VTKSHTPPFNPRPIIYSQPLYTDTKLVYCDQASYDATTSTVAYNCYRANSVFDPDLTGAGHQPMGYDQQSALYHCWVVPAVHLEFTITPGSTATQGVVYGAFWQDTPTIISTSVNVLRELRKGPVEFFVPGNGTPKTIKTTFDNSRYYSLSQEAYIEQGSNGFGGCIDTNPARGSYLFVWVGTTLSTNEPAAVNVNVRLTYDTRFFAPIANTASLKEIHPKTRITSDVDAKDDSCRSVGPTLKPLL